MLYQNFQIEIVFRPSLHKSIRGQAGIRLVDLLYSALVNKTPRYDLLRTGLDRFLAGQSRSQLTRQFSK